MDEEGDAWKLGLAKWSKAQQNWSWAQQSDVNDTRLDVILKSKPVPVILL